MNATVNQQEDIQDVDFATDEVVEPKIIYPWQKGAIRPWEKGFLWPWQKEFCMPYWVGITLVIVFAASLFIPFIWYVITAGLN